MSKSSAQDVHANQPGGAVDAHLNQWDITDSLNGTVDLEATYMSSSGPDMLWGNGNSPSGYHLSDNNTLGIELGLKEHVRSTGPDLVHTAGADGVANVVAPAGTDSDGKHALWNFDYVVDTGLNHSTSTLSDFAFKLQITQTQNGATNTQIFDLNPLTHVWTNEANPASHFGGDDFQPHPQAPGVEAQIAENSENLGFLGGVFGSLADATHAGTTYDIQLEAFSGVRLAGLVHDHITLALA